MVRQRIYIEGQWGLGDNIYARPFIKELVKTREIFIDTPWPELYCDTDVRFVKGSRQLRTQLKNIKRQRNDLWHYAPPVLPAQRWHVGYFGHELPKYNIPQVLQKCFHGIDPHWSRWDLPDWGLPCPVENEKPIAVIRPVTMRSEWINKARPPKWEYICQIAEWLMPTHDVVSVADCDIGEHIIGDEPPCHFKFHKGELPVEELLTLVRHADVVVGGVGWIVPASIALKVNAFIVLGGHGAHNAPNVITDPAMDLTWLGFATPEKYCLCSNMNHQCAKDIPDLRQQWESYWRKQGLKCAGMTADSSGTPPQESAGMM
jgi:hypothetical protein